MSTQPQATLIHGAWNPQVPELYLKHLRAALTSTEHAILGIIWVDTQGGRPALRQQWLRVAQNYFSPWTNCTVEQNQRALKSLESKGLIRSRRVGRLLEYQCIRENWAQCQPRARRTLRKPQSIETSPHRHVVVEEREKPAACGFVDGKEVKTSTTIIYVVDQNREEKEREDSIHEAPPAKSEVAPTSSSDIQTLEEWCLVNITPKLGDCPPQNVIETTLRNLGGAPLDMLYARVFIRFADFKKWGFLPKLAQDVQKAHLKLSRLPKVVSIDLSTDWASSVKVRRLHAASDTPAGVKEEILRMWPELGRKKTKGERIKEMMEQIK